MRTASSTCLHAALAALLSIGVPDRAAADAAAAPQWFAPATDAAFAGYRQPLIAYLRAKGPRATNTVCLIGERHADGSAWVWAIWTEGRRMVLWDGGDAPMTASRRDLDLRRDVVPDEAGLRGSTYRVTKAFVAAAERRCAHDGTTVRLPRREVISEGSR